MSPLQEQRCREKTLRRNVYHTKRAAKLKALQLSRRCGETIVHFRCRACPFWHVGKPRKLSNKE